MLHLAGKFVDCGIKVSSFSPFFVFESEKLVFDHNKMGYPSSSSFSDLYLYLFVFYVSFI